VLNSTDLAGKWSEMLLEGMKKKKKESHYAWVEA